MFRPVEMCKVNILVLSKHVTAMTRILGQRGLVHLVDAVNQSRSKLLSSINQDKDERATERQLDRCERLIEAFGVESDAEAPQLGSMDLKDMEALLDKIHGHFKLQDDAINKLIGDSGSLSLESNMLAGYPLQKVRLEALRNLSHFYMITGRIAPSVLPSASMIMGERALLLPAEGKDGNVLVLSSRKNRWAVEEELRKFGFATIEMPQAIKGSAADERKQVEDELQSLHRQLEECRLQVLKLGENYGGVLLAMRSQLRGLKAVHKAQKHFGRVSHLYCISGWTPKSEVEKVRQIVEENTDGSGVVEVIEAGEDLLVQAGVETVPVQFKGAAWLRPFRMLVTNFAIPRYNELDPTLFVGLSFVVLFGFMFGDIGQGAVLALIGLWMHYSRRAFSETVRDLGFLLLACGLSASLFGFLYGSCFGYENHNLFPPLWLSPLAEKDIGRLLLVAVGVGIVFTSVAIMINIINRFMARHYFDGVFDRFGVLGLLFYWLALGIGISVALTRQVTTWQLIVLTLPLFLLFIGKPGQLLLQRFRSSKKRGEEEDDDEEGGSEHSGMLELVLESCIELMETFTGYISGTVSFVRVGAFAISHAALCLAVFSIVNMLKELPLGGTMSLLVIILGNALVIAFEGMVAMIQGIRLEYYELFSKYFSGGGVLYRPFQIGDGAADDVEMDNKGETKA
jgi:V/A-type H+-transporting ATPase subunit I